MNKEQFLKYLFYILFYFYIIFLNKYRNMYLNLRFLNEQYYININYIIYNFKIIANKARNLLKKN